MYSDRTFIKVPRLPFKPSHYKFIINMATAVFVETDNLQHSTRLTPESRSCLELHTRKSNEKGYFHLNHTIVRNELTTISYRKMFALIVCVCMNNPLLSNNKAAFGSHPESLTGSANI